MSLKGELVIRDGGKWYVSRNIVHTDDYSLHLVVGEIVEFELDRMGFARIIGSISVRQACVNSLKLFFSLRKSVPLSALDFVNQNVLNASGITPVMDKSGKIIYHTDGSPMTKLSVS